MSVCVGKQPYLATDTLCGMVTNKCRGRITRSEFGVIALKFLSIKTWRKCHSKL